MARHWAGLLGGLILAWLPLAAPAAGTLEAASDLHAEAARAAQAGGPLIVIYSRADCRFCQTVKRDYLEPLTRHPTQGKRLLVREIGQDTDTPLRDFAGQASTHARYAAQRKIKLVPVVAFYGPDGRELAPPIVGARIADFYQSYLDSAIEESARQLKRP